MSCTLHILPNILTENTYHLLPVSIEEIIIKTNIYFVEEIKSARRLIKAIHKLKNIDDCTFYMLNEHDNSSLKNIKEIFENNKHIGLISEAGCAAVADPGNDLVLLAHENNVKVVPYIAPNSIIMSLMASGFNGQQFCFHGYLPIKQPMLKNKILELEKNAMHATQIFIETPYRNDALLKELISTCNSQSKLCVACNITSADELIVSKTIKEWSKQTISFHKKPAVFLLYAG